MIFDKTTVKKASSRKCLASYIKLHSEENVNNAPGITEHQSQRFTKQLGKHSDTFQWVLPKEHKKQHRVSAAYKLQLLPTPNFPRP